MIKRLLLALAIIWSLTSNAQINTGMAITAPSSICGSQMLELLVESPQQFVSYKAYVPGLSRPVDSIPARSYVFNSFVKGGFTFPGSFLTAGPNVISITGSITNVAYRIPDNSITIDGELSEGYNLSSMLQLPNLTFSQGGASPHPSNSAMFGLLWDTKNLYIGVQVIDNTLTINPVNQALKDKIEIYFDPYEQDTVYAINDVYGVNSPLQRLKMRQIVVDFDAPVNRIRLQYPDITPGNIPRNNDTTGIRLATKTFTGSGYTMFVSGLVNNGRKISGTGYKIEFAIPWSNFYGVDTIPVAGTAFGFDLSSIDYQSNQATPREQMFWNASYATNDKFKDSQGFGSIVLVGSTQEVLINTATVSSTIAAAPAATITFAGLCAPNVTVTSVNPAPAGKTFYWQQNAIGQSTAIVAATSTTGMSYVPNTTLTSIYLTSYDPGISCWSSPVTYEIIPTVNNSIADISITTICGNSFITVANTVSGNTWYWQSSATGTSMTSFAGIAITTSGIGTYFLRAQNNATKCWSPASASATVDVSMQIPQNPTTITAISVLPCLGQTVSVSGILSGNEKYYMQTASTGTDIALSIENNVLAITTTGSYFAKALNTLTGCWSPNINVPSYTISNIGLPSPPQNPTPIRDLSCDSAVLTYQNPQIIRDVNWYWVDTRSAENTTRPAVTTTVNGISVETTVYPLIITTPGVSTAYVRAKDNAGCWSDTIAANTRGHVVTIIGLPQAPEVTSTDTAACGNLIVTLTTLSGSNSIYWHKSIAERNDSLQRLISIGLWNVSTSGTYYFRVKSNTGALNCWSDYTAKTAYIEYTPAEPPIPTATPGCGVVTLSGGAIPSGIAYEWSINTITSNVVRNANFVATASGNYFLRAKTLLANCPSASFSNLYVTVGEVTSLPSPIVSSPINYTQNEIVNNPLTISGIEADAVVRWFSGTLAGDTISPPVPNTGEIGTRTYFVSQSKNYCESEKSSITVNVLKAIVDLDRKNIGITPNGDGANEAFTIDNITNFPGNNLKILDKWGNVVYEASGYKNTFNGSRDSDKLPTGTYYFVLDLGDGTKKQTGSLVIVR